MLDLGGGVRFGNYFLGGAVGEKTYPLAFFSSLWLGHLPCSFSEGGF